MVGIPKERNLAELENLIRDELRLIATLANRLDEFGDAFTIKGIRCESKKILKELQLLERFINKYEKVRDAESSEQT